MRKPSLLPVIFSLALIIFYCPDFSSGQTVERYHVTIDHFRTEQGLTANITSNGIQDNRGFLWTPTPNGLARFDGEDFLNLGRVKNKLQGNDIFHLVEDNQGFIWLLYLVPGTGATSSGKIDLLDTRTLMARPAMEVYPEIAKLDGIAHTIFSDTHKNIFILTEKGNVYKKMTEGSFKLIFSTPIQSLGLINTRIFAGKEFLWILPTDTTAISFRYSDGKTSEIKTPEDAYLQPLQPDANEQLLVLKGSVKGKKIYPEVFKFTTDGKVIVTGEYLAGKKNLVSRIIPPITSARQFNGDAMIVHFPDEGIFLRDKNGEYSELLGNDELKEYPDLIAAHTIFTTPNTCWFFSQTKGLFKITFSLARFTNYMSRSVLPPGLHQEYCQARGIYEDNKGNLYVNSWLGLLKADTKKPGATPESIKPNTYGLGIGVFDSVIYAFNDEIASYDLNMNLKYRIPVDDEGIIGRAWSMLKTDDGRLWLGTENGMAYTDDVNRKITPYPWNDGLIHKNQFVYQIIKDSNNSLWAVSSWGLINFNPEGGPYKLYHRNGKGIYKLPFEDIFTIYEDRDKNFWIGTNGNGLVKWDRKTGKTESFTVAEGLSSNVIYGILPEQLPEGENLWMSSTYGLMCFNTLNHIVKTYTQKDGLAFNEFNRSSYYKSKSGLFYFGGIDGVTSFLPALFSDQDQPFNAPLQILAFNQFVNKANTLTDLTADLLSSNSIELKPGDKFFTLRFSLMNFENEKPSYAYKFDGYDAGWNHITENSIRISNLPSGNYKLRIKGQNNQGQWSTSELVIPVSVLTPFYKNPIFIVTSIIAFALFAFFFYRWNTRKLKLEKVKLELEVEKRTEKIEQQKTKLMEMDKIKSRFFANISHELRTPLTLITGPVDAMLHGQYGELNPNLQKALSRTEKNGKQLMRFIEQILDLSRLESGKLMIHEKAVLLTSEIRKIESSFQELARTKHQEWLVDYEIPEDLIVLMDDDKFEKIIYNLLSNAFKFTPQFGQVRLVVKPVAKHSFQSLPGSKTELVFEIIDTGKGIPSEDLPFIFDRFFQSSKMEESNAGGSGIGLAFSKELTEALGGTLTARSEQGKGSTFRLVLPFQVASSVPLTEKVTDEAAGDLIQMSVPLEEESKIHLKKLHTVLVVDDNIELLQFITEILTPLFKVVTANDGVQALELLEQRTHAIDFIISDVMMPRMDGFELLEKLKSHPEWKKLPVVLLTAKATTEHKIRALRTGVDDYLFKPFSTAELLARVQNLLHHYEERSEEPFGDITMNASGTVSLHTDKVLLREYDLQWLEKAESICKSNISNTMFGIPDLADHLAVSERQLHRRINELTGLTPNKYIREIKLQHARELLEVGRFKTVAEVAYHVAFEKPEYFSKLFAERFGVKPGEMLKN